MEQRIPFSYVIISPENVTEKEGCMISTIDKCGFFFCQKGEVEVALSDKSYLISKGSVCIYMTGSLLRIQRISKDIKGIMLEVDLNYIIPIVNKIVNSENLLYLRENPCFSITEYQYSYLEQLIKALQQRMDIKAHDIPLQRQHLISELSYKWAEVLDADAFSLFKQCGIFNPEIADSFRRNILSKGGTEHPMTLYKRFRGQEPTIDALLIRNGIKR